MRTNFLKSLKPALIVFLCVSFFYECFSQKKMNEQRALKESHIDFTKEYISFTIHGLIEINGHTFENDTCACPIQFQANLDGITIIDTCSNVNLKHRECGDKNCKIVHLTKEEGTGIRISSPNLKWWNGRDIIQYPTVETEFPHRK